MAVSHLMVFTVLVAAAAAEVTTFKTCRDLAPEHCTVTQVRINPCKKSGECSLKRGTNASISFDFTPNFATSNLRTEVMYSGTSFAELGRDACVFSTCPTVPGVSQTFNYNLYIGKKLPKGTFPISWKVWNDDSAEQICCFSTTIKLK